MARESSITQEQVNAAADAIRSGGAKPTARAVRERLGSGSMATVLKLLQVWQGGQIKQDVQAVTLPPALQRYLVDFVAQEVATARADLEGDLVAIQAAQVDLIAESERQASTIEVQAEVIDLAQAEQARQAGRMGQLEADLAKAGEDVQKERLAAEAARTELAKAQLRLEAMPRIEADLATLRGDMAAERQARAIAEQAAAVASAEFKASERRAGDIEQRATQAEARIAGMLKAADAAAAEAKATAQNLASASGELLAERAKLEAATRELDQVRQAIATAQQVAAKATEEAAELRGQIAALSDQAAEPEGNTKTPAAGARASAKK